jgi:hypothetical protein
MKNIKALGFLVKPDFEKTRTDIMLVLCHIRIRRIYGTLFNNFATGCFVKIAIAPTLLWTIKPLGFSICPGSNSLLIK